MHFFDYKIYKSHDFPTFSIHFYKLVTFKFTSSVTISLCQLKWMNSSMDFHWHQSQQLPLPPLLPQLLLPKKVWDNLQDTQPMDGCEEVMTSS